MMNVSPRSVKRARKVLDSGDEELIDAVTSGEVSGRTRPEPSEFTVRYGTVRAAVAGVVYTTG